MTTVILKPVHERDPADVIMEQVGNLEDFELFHNNVLVAVYQRPAAGQLGGKPFFLSDGIRGEDKYQGIVGLVLAKGPAAFVEDANTKFYGNDVDVGDWVFLRASDGVKMKVKGVLCWRVRDVLIDGRIPDPDYVY